MSLLNIIYIDYLKKNTYRVSVNLIKKYKLILSYVNF